MIDHLSVSSIKMFMRCARQWEFRYVKGLIIPPAGAMILGSAYHHALAKGFSDLAEKEEMPKVDIVLDAFDNSWSEQTRSHETEEDGEQFQFDDIDWRDDPGRLKDAGYKLTELYATNEMPKVKGKDIISVEKYEKTEVYGIRFDMIKDLELTGTIIDHKVKKRRFNDNELLNDIQPTAYLANGPKEFEYQVALDQKVQAIATFNVTRTDNDWEFFKEIVSSTWAAIKTGIFPPNVEGWSCSKDWCGYYQLCRGRK